MKSQTSKKPPFTNRGVERTENSTQTSVNAEKNANFTENQDFNQKREDTYLLVDWIQATIMNDNLNIYSLFKELFNIDTRLIVKEAKGFFGYDTTFSYKDIKIMTAEYRKLEGLQDMGYHIYISGQGCRDLEDLKVDYQKLFQKLLDYGARFTRLDISIDDFSKKYFTIPLIRKAVKNGDVVTRFRNSIEFLKTKLVDGTNNGYTIWFGSRASNIQIVFYDKLKERESQDYIVSNDVSFWIRLECRFRNFNANQMATNFASLDFNEFKNFYIGVVSNYLRFVVNNPKDKNKRRWKTVAWWQNFVEDIPRISLQTINVESTILKKRNWLMNTVSRNNFMVLVSDMEFLSVDDILGSYLYEFLKEGMGRVNDHDIQYINDLRIKKGLVTVNKEEFYEFLYEVKEQLEEKKVGILC